MGRGRSRRWPMQSRCRRRMAVMTECEGPMNIECKQTLRKKRIGTRGDSYARDHRCDTSAPNSYPSVEALPSRTHPLLELSFILRILAATSNRPIRQLLSQVCLSDLDQSLLLRLPSPSKQPPGSRSVPQCPLLDHFAQRVNSPFRIQTVPHSKSWLPVHSNSLPSPPPLGPFPRPT